MRLPVCIAVLLLAPGLSGCVGLAVRAVRETQRPKLDQVFDQADENHDGIITRAEFRDARARLFVRLDRNGDGYLDKADSGGRLMRRRQGSTQISRLMQQLDKDGDGRVSRAEFLDGPAVMFDRADSNHDGVVDAQELAAFRASAAGR
jgi:Ca2+-binding EF-hand superfamily protein